MSDDIKIRYDVPSYIDEPYPFINNHGLTAAEREHSDGLFNSLADLHGYLRDFYAAVTLFRVLIRVLPADEESAVILMLQKMAACREGVMAVYHFASSMDATLENLNALPEFLARIDKADRRIAEKLFASFFPSIRQLRNAVAHSGELAGTAKDFNSNKLRKKFDDGHMIFEQSTVQNYLAGTTYSRTINGVMVSCDITMKSVEKLNRAKQVYWAVFRPLTI